MATNTHNTGMQTRAPLDLTDVCVWVNMAQSIIQTFITLDEHRKPSLCVSEQTTLYACIHLLENSINVLNTLNVTAG